MTTTEDGVPFRHMSVDQLRSICRRRLEACELWLRRFLAGELERRFGRDYFRDSQLSGQQLFSATIRSAVSKRILANPGRYAREVDALTYGELANVLCKQEVWSEIVSPALRASFPLGGDHLRFALDRLIAIRNSLAHSNGISVSDVEIVLADCGVIIEGLKDYYRGSNNMTAFPAPSFVKFLDSLGNEHHPTNTEDAVELTDRPLYVGDRLRMEIEVDESFDPKTYEVLWAVGNVPNGESAVGSSFELTLSSAHVGMHFSVHCRVVSKEAWHRHRRHDASLWITYQVRPLN